MGAPVSGDMYQGIAVGGEPSTKWRTEITTNCASPIAIYTRLSLVDDGTSHIEVHSDSEPSILDAESVPVFWGLRALESCSFISIELSLPKGIVARPSLNSLTYSSRPTSQELEIIKAGLNSNPIINPDQAPAEPDKKILAQKTHTIIFDEPALKILALKTHYLHIHLSGTPVANITLASHKINYLASVTSMSESIDFVSTIRLPFRFEVQKIFPAPINVTTNKDPEYRFKPSNPYLGSIRGGPPNRYTDIGVIYSDVHRKQLENFTYTALGALLGAGIAALLGALVSFVSDGSRAECMGEEFNPSDNTSRHRPLWPAWTASRRHSMVRSVRYKGLPRAYGTTAKRKR